MDNELLCNTISELPKEIEEFILKYVTSNIVLINDTFDMVLKVAGLELWTQVSRSVNENSILKLHDFFTLGENLHSVSLVNKSKIQSEFQNMVSELQKNGYSFVRESDKDELYSLRVPFLNFNEFNLRQSIIMMKKYQSVVRRLH